MPLFGRKSRDNTNISGPVEGHTISTSDSQEPSTMLSNNNDPIFEEPAGIVSADAHDRGHASSSIHPDPARVAHPNANLPAGAVDPRRGVGANTLPAGVPPGGPIPNSQEWQRQHGEGETQVTVEERMPFKEQVKAWAKVHRGTILRDHEQKELGQKILAGEVPPQ